MNIHTCHVYMRIKKKEKKVKKKSFKLYSTVTKHLNRA